MPLDADPEDPRQPASFPDGNIVIARHVEGTPVARYVKAGQGNHRSHFASCPHAASHRKAKQ